MFRRRYFNQIITTNRKTFHSEKTPSSVTLFHDSWFNSAPQTSKTTREASISDTIEDQMNSFRSRGYAIIRRSDGQNLKDISQLRLEILQSLENQQSSSWYSFNRYFKLLSDIRAPNKRHSIPLPYSITLFSVLTSAIKNIRPLLQCYLPKNAPLVDLSSIISFPGSERQKTHSDVPFTTSNKIIASFVALSTVSMTSGPTCLFAGSHTEAFHRRHVNSSILDPSFYSSDGSSDDIDSLSQHSYDDGRKNNTPNTAVDDDNTEDSNAVNLAASSRACAALLEPGDVLLYDTSLFHYGGANSSTDPRALLMFSFQGRYSFHCYILTVFIHTLIHTYIHTYCT